MQSRMDKYNQADVVYKSRTKKNQDLYEQVKNSSLTDFNVNSNVSVIDTNANKIDVNRLSEILDKRYNEYNPKRKSIEVPAYDEEPIINQPLMDTKEYDINAILEKAKQGKNVDYNKERLKKVREAQYEILNNLDLELKKVEDAKRSNQKKAEEDNLMNLINTITQIEIQNKENKYNKDTKSSFDLLSDLADDSDDDKTEPLPNVEAEKLEPEESKSEIITLMQSSKEEAPDEELEKNESDEKEKEEKLEAELEENDDKTKHFDEKHIEETLSKLDIDISSYDDFSDVSKNDTGTVVIKVLIFAVIIALVIGAIYILNTLLDLGLF